MGLDSVELILAFEQYFKIEIPDREAESMYCINNVVDYLASADEMNPEAEPTLVLLRSKFSDFLNIAPNDAIFEQYKISNKTFWQQIEVATNLKIVLPDDRDIKSQNFFQRLFYRNPDYISTQITYERFLEVIASVNYETLINPASCNTRQALIIAVMGITIHKNGLDPYEVFPSSKFVDDLGIN